MDKKSRLQSLKEEMLQDDSLPLKKGATNLVFSDGDPESKIMCIGEGPGYNEDQKGIPFIGMAGNLLNKLFLTIGIERPTVFITNVVHHRPPENRDPFPEEIEAYGKYLDKIIEIVEPRIIITLGRFSMGKFLPWAKISDVHGKKYPIKWKERDILVVPMYHPAASLRNGAILAAEKLDFLKLPEYIKEATKEIVTQETLI